MEHPTDLILPFSGIYSEVSYQGGQGSPPKNGADSAYSMVWELERFWEVAHWLLPDAGTCVAIRKPGPKEAESAHAWLFRHHLTPLVADWDFGLSQAQLNALQAEYVDAEGRWKR